MRPDGKQESEKTMIDIQAVFSSEPPDRTATLSEPAPSLGTATPRPGEPKPLPPKCAEAVGLDAWLAAQDWSKWTYEAGRYSGPEASPEDDFPSLSAPGKPCPACNRLSFCTDLLGGRHCQKCEAGLVERSFKLADRAERLRDKPRPEPLPDRAPAEWF